MNARTRTAAMLRNPLSILVVLGLVFALGLIVGKSPNGDKAAPTNAEAGEALLYTCSMHPSVRLADPDAKCPICFMDLIPVTESRAGANQITLEHGVAAAARVETTPVRRDFPEAQVRLFGSITYDQTRIARLTAYFPGRIERLFANYVGVPVSRGDHLAELYSPQLLSAVAELREARRSAETSSGQSSLVRESTSQVLEAARQRLRLLGLHEEQVRAAESGSDTGLSLTIYAPIGGVVTELAVREGDYVKTGETIATVADLSRLWLDLEAYESQLPLLRWGQRVTFTVQARPGDTFEGRIAFIEPGFDAQTRTVAVRVAVDNTDRALSPGMFATATVTVNMDDRGAVASDHLAGRWVSPMHPTVVKNGPGQCDVCGMDLVPAESLGVVGDPATARAPLVIPRSAVLFTGPRSLVYVAVDGADGVTYESREVELGPRAGAVVTVRSGLSEGEEVVTRGAFRIDSAMQIAAKPSMMSERSGERDGEYEDASPSFITALSPVYAAYLDLQAALADDDLDAARKASRSLDSALDRLEASLTDVQRGGNTPATLRRLRVGDSTATIESLRQRFESVSEAVIDLEGRYGHALGETLAHVHCPMAFDNRGADWLQRGTTIDNPYFGARMLRCGEIREEVPARVGVDSHEGHDHE